MSKNVVISKTAKRKLENLFDYLIENWSLKVKTDFVKKLDRSILLIKENPKNFPQSIKIKRIT